jgi:hypothetical protein
MRNIAQATAHRSGENDRQEAARKLGEDPPNLDRGMTWGRNARRATINPNNA